MSNPILLRDRLFAGQLDAATISEHLEGAETGLIDVAQCVRTGKGKRLLDKLMEIIAERPQEIVASMARHPDRVATLFAFLPAYEMFALFEQIEAVEPSLLPAAVEHAPQGVLRTVARERFSFLGAMSKLCVLLTCCKRPNRHPSM